MKTLLYRFIFCLVLTFFTMPLLAQDCLVLFFHDGSFRQFYLKDIVEITSSKVDAEGVQHHDYQYQHIITHSNHYTYIIEDIDSITFSKYNEELAEQNFVEAMPNVFSSISDCKTISDAESHLEEIQHFGGVEDAWSDGHLLHVKIAEGETFTFHFNHDSSIKDDWIGTRQLQNRVRALLPTIKEREKSTGKKLKAVIANMQFKDEKRKHYIEDYHEPLLQTFRDCNIDPYYVENPTIDFFYGNSSDPDNLHIYDYDIILLDTHGGYYAPRYYKGKNLLGFNLWGTYKKCHVIATAEDIFMIEEAEAKNDKNKPKWKDYYTTFKEWREKTKYKDVTEMYINFQFIPELRGEKWYWVAHPMLTEYFFSDYAPGRFHDNSILFNQACESLKGNDTPSYSFANILLEQKNLGTYLGYTETNIYGCQTMPEFFSYMLKHGSSFGNTYWELPKYRRHETEENRNEWPNIEDDQLKKKIYNAELKILPENNEKIRARFLVPVYTNSVDPKIVTESFLNEKAVTISGTATFFIKPNAKMIGFKYGKDKNNLSEIKVAENVVETENQGYGNYYFSAKLTNLEPDNTYYYCAATFDGTYYNYGDTCSFTLNKPVVYPNLKLSVTDPISLVVGESTKIKVLAGSGKYSVKISNNKVTVKVEDDEVIIEAVSEGPVTITVIDTETYQAISVEIEVVKKAEVPEGAIDLGLPSGTLWAAYNVGATKPEEYGLYFAWGETQGYRADERHYFGWSTYKWSNGGYNKLTKYCTNADYGTVDNKTTLDLEDDAARVNWGMPWRMPTHEQIEELKDNCWTDWAEKNGVSGMLYTSKINGKSVFFPAAGIRWEFELDWDGSGSWFFWSSTVNEKQPCFAYDLSRDSYIYSGGRYVYTYNRYFGRSVRAVISGGQEPAPNLALASTAPVSLTIGETTKVMIISGNGQYSIRNSNPDAVSANILNNAVEIKALQPGEATITVIDDVSNQTVSFTVTVAKKLVNLVLSTYDPITLQVNAGVTFTIESGNGNYTVKSSDEAVATANLRDNYIDVRGVAPGTATITVTDVESGQTASIQVTVAKKLVNLVLSTYDPITLDVNAGVTFSIESGNGNYTVKSSDNTVATVNLRDNYVDVHGVAPGTATITVTDVESGQTASIQVTVAAPVCPARITNVELTSAQYHRDEDNQNQMYYKVSARLDDLTDIEEWGICYHRTTISEFPFESVSNEQYINMRYSIANSNLGKSTTLLKTDFNAYVATYEGEVGVYVKKRDKTSGNLMTIYGDLYSFSLRYDTKPSFVLFSPAIKETKVVSTSGSHKQYETTVTYNYTVEGVFWIDYIAFGVSGNGWSDGGSSKWYLQKDHTSDSYTTERYWDNSKLNHSIFEKLYLRNSKLIYSNYINMSGSGMITNVWTSTSPAYTSRQMEPDEESADGESENDAYMNYVEFNVPAAKDKQAETRRAIKQIPYYEGVLEEVVPVQE